MERLCYCVTWRVTCSVPDPPKSKSFGQFGGKGPKMHKKKITSKKMGCNAQWEVCWLGLTSSGFRWSKSHYLMSTGFCRLILATRTLLIISSSYYNKYSKLLSTSGFSRFLMSSKTKLCTCQKFCQAPPEGKATPLRTWYRHAAQRALEEGMDLGVREAQQRHHPRNMNKVCATHYYVLYPMLYYISV